MTNKEIDKLIAEKVMGNEILYENHYWLEKTHPTRNMGYLRHYSTDISDAFLVVEKMEEIQYLLVLQKDNFKYWSALFFNEEKDDGGVVIDESASMTICKAALKVFE